MLEQCCKLQAAKCLFKKEVLLRRRRETKIIQSGGLELRSCEPAQNITVVPLGGLLKDSPSHLSTTASQNRKKGIAQLQRS